MAEAFAELCQQDRARDLSPADWLALMVEREQAFRSTKRATARLGSHNNNRKTVPAAHVEVMQMNNNHGAVIVMGAPQSGQAPPAPGQRRRR